MSKSRVLKLVGISIASILALMLVVNIPRIFEQNKVGYYQVNS